MTTKINVGQEILRTLNSKTEYDNLGVAARWELVRRVLLYLVRRSKR